MQPFETAEITGRYEADRNDWQQWLGTVKLTDNGRLKRIAKRMLSDGNPQTRSTTEDIRTGRG